MEIKEPEIAIGERFEGDEIFSPYGVKNGELPHDVLNSVTYLSLALEISRSKEELSEYLKNLKTFQDYFIEKAKGINNKKRENNDKPFDVETVLESAIRIIGPELVEKFNSKMARLREWVEEINDVSEVELDKKKKEIQIFINEEIEPLVHKRL